jgi:AcrR family transcriptional regulator
MPARTRKKRAPLTPDRVLEAALKLADSGGLDALSMRNIAQALKVEAMSLYNHVDGKERILDGLVERVLAELDWTPRADWKASMRERAFALHGALMRHPWATMLFVARLNIGPNMLRFVDQSIGCLREAGFSYPLADYAWNALDAYTYGFTLQKLNFPLEPSEYASSAKQFLPMIPAETHPFLRGLSEEVIAGRHDGLQRLEFGLDLLLDGFERLRSTALTS